MIWIATLMIQITASMMFSATSMMFPRLGNIIEVVKKMLRNALRKGIHSCGYAKICSRLCQFAIGTFSFWICNPAAQH
jgi:hypothetical protein